MRNHKAIVVDRPIFDIRGVRMADSTIQFSFITPSTLRTSDRVIRYVDIFASSKEDGAQDAVMVNPTVAGTPGVDEVLYFIGEGLWDTPQAITSQRAFVDVSVVTSTDHLIFKSVIEFSKAEPMDLMPFVQSGKESVAEIGVTARRIFVPQGEYLPSSEAFRVIITDNKGTVVWRSDAGLAFLSIVGDVQPQTANAVHRYIMPWDGKDISGNTVSDGEYNAELIIPARPKAYQTTTSFKWPLR